MRNLEVEIWQKPHKRTRSTGLPIRLQYNKTYMDVSTTVWPLNDFRSVRHLGFFKFGNVKGRKGQGITVPYIMVIGQTVAEIYSRPQNCVPPQKATIDIDRDLYHRKNRGAAVPLSMRSWVPI